MKTFRYTGPAKKLRVLDVELTKGTPFTTTDKKVIARLSLLVDVEEVKEAPKEEKKPLKSDAVKS